MLIKDNVPDLHKRVAEFLAKENLASSFLQCFSVVDGKKHMISRIMFRKGGLKDFLEACRNPSSPIFISEKAEATQCCTKLSLYISERMSQFNNNRPEGRNPIPFGSKIWVGSALGLYFTIGNQDLESFFEEGKRLAQQRLEEEVDGGDHRYGDPS